MKILAIIRYARYLEHILVKFLHKVSRLRLNLFEISMMGPQVGAEEFHRLIGSIGLKAELRPDSESIKWRVTARQVPSRLLDEKKEEIFAYSKTHTYDLLVIETEDGYFDLSEAPSECFSDFLKNPRYICFPPVATLQDGLRKSLENALQLAYGVDSLFASEKTRAYLGLMSFLLLTSIEEVGKACMIVAAAKEAKRQGWKTAVVRGLRHHSKKFHIAGKQLEPLAIRLYLYDQASFLHELRNPPKGMEEGILGKLHREYGLYVGYSPSTKRWRTFQSQYESTLVSDFSESSIEAWTRLLKTACNALLQEAQDKQVYEMKELGEMFEREF